MTENTKGVLAYIIPILGIIFLFTDKETSREIKVHYAQAAVLMVADIILSFVAGFIAGLTGIGLVSSLVNIGYVVIMIIGAVKVYRNEEYNLPVITENALKIFAKQIDAEG